MAILNDALEDNENKKIPVDTGRALSNTLNIETKRGMVKAGWLEVAADLIDTNLTINC